MKKILSILVVLGILFGAVSASAATMYATDGRSTYVPDSDVELWENVGWYRESDTITVYAADGRTKIIPEIAFNAWHAVGWYSAPVMTVYATDGRTQVILKTDYDAWKKVGWMEFPMEQVYAPMLRAVCKDSRSGWEAYVYYDINKDGVKEMIVDDGLSEAERRYHVYTIVDGYAERVGAFYGSHSYLAHIPNSNGVLVMWGHMGAAGARRVEMVNGRLVEKTVREEREYPGEYPEAWDVIKGSFNLKMTYVSHPEYN